MPRNSRCPGTTLCFVIAFVLDVHPQVPHWCFDEGEEQDEPDLMLVKVEPAMFSQGSFGFILQYFGVHGVFVHDTT